VVRLFSFLLDKRRVSVSVDVDSNSTLLSQAVEIGNEWRPSISTATPVIPSLPQAINTISVPLIRIAHARSGDKGDNSNVGVIARSANIWLWLQENLTAEQVAAYMAHPVKGQVERYELPGIMALNFVLQRALGGGGMASLQSDPLGKCYAQMLLDMPVEIPIPLLGAGTKQ
jgi:hypothetical protein